MIRKNKYPLRRVVEETWNQGSLKCLLSCGHEVYAPEDNQGEPTFATSRRCHHCAREAGQIQAEGTDFHSTDDPRSGRQYVPHPASGGRELI